MNGAAKKYYPWVICLSCLLAEFVVTGLVCNLLGSYFPYMQTELGFTNTQTSSFLTVRSISNGFCALFLKKFYDRLGARKGLSLSGLPPCGRYKRRLCPVHLPYDEGPAL